ncbi:MAG: hypothetical protein KIT79_07430 [Deltaproteobacteria bacterium]|nr:hypothetical protein [Deltaproteobacteria bacterium]
MNFRKNLADAWRSYLTAPAHLSLVALLSLLLIPTIILTGPGMLLLCGAARAVRRGEKPGLATVKNAFAGFPDDYVIGIAYAFSVLVFVPTFIGWMIAAVILGPVFIIRSENAASRGAGIVETFREAASTCGAHPGDAVPAAFAIIALNLVAAFGGVIGLLVTLPVSALALVQLWEQWSGGTGGQRVEQVYDFRSSL